MRTASNLLGLPPETGAEQLQSKLLLLFEEAQGSTSPIERSEEERKAVFQNLCEAQGIVGALYNLISEAKQLQKDEARNEEGHDGKTIIYKPDQKQVVDSFTKTGQVPLSLWLEHAHSTKEALGAVGIEKEKTEQAIARATLVLKACKNDPYHKTRNETRIERYRKHVDKCERRQEATRKHLNNILKDISRNIGRNLVAGCLRYEEAIDATVSKEKSQFQYFNDLCADISNNFDPHVGENFLVPFQGTLRRAKVLKINKRKEVQIKFQDFNDLCADISNNFDPHVGENFLQGTLQRAKVLKINKRKEDQTEYKVSLWVRTQYTGAACEEGFNTSNRIAINVTRRNMYPYNQAKLPQTINEETVAKIVQNVQGTGSMQERSEITQARLTNQERPEFLACLYIDAASSHTRMQKLRWEILNTVVFEDSGLKPEVMLPPLKNFDRGTVKANEKYGGSYKFLTDIARMTVVCETFSMATTFLTFLKEHEQWEIVRLKNRLLPEFDASFNGGYKDVLCNARDQTNGHIVEIQISLTNVMEIKSGKGHSGSDTGGNGHSDYKLARLLELNGKENTYFYGDPDNEILEKIESGVLRHVTFTSTNISESLMDKLLPPHHGSNSGLLSPACAIWKIDLDNPFDRTVTSLPFTRVLDSLKTIGPNLNRLCLRACALDGPIPVDICTQCPQLKYLIITDNDGVNGNIPQEIGLLGHLKELRLNNNRITGEIPQSIGNLTKLVVLRLSSNKLCGEIPECVGNLAGLAELGLHKNQLTGQIPASVGMLKNVTYLSLHTNNLTGSLPKELGEMSNMVYLSVSNNDISGEIPSSLTELRTLHKLDLCANSLSGGFPNFLGKIYSLRSLALHGNDFNFGEVPKGFEQLDDLQDLSLDEKNCDPQCSPENMARGVVCHYDTKQSIEKFLDKIRLMSIEKSYTESLMTLQQQVADLQSIIAAFKN